MFSCTCGAKMSYRHIRPFYAYMTEKCKWGQWDISVGTSTCQWNVTTWVSLPDSTKKGELAPKWLHTHTVIIIRIVAIRINNYNNRQRVTL